MNDKEEWAAFAADLRKNGGGSLKVLVIALAVLEALILIPIVVYRIVH